VDSLREEKKQDLPPHPVERLLELREYVAELDADEPYFKLNDSPLYGHHGNPEPFLILINSWPIPSILVDTTISIAVNPHYSDRAELSDVYVDGDCDCILTGTRHKMPSEQNGELCNPIAHAETEKQWWGKRRRILQKSLFLNQSREYMADRLAVSKSHIGKIIHQQFDFSAGDIRSKGDDGLKLLIDRIWPHFTNSDLETALGFSKHKLKRLHNEPLNLPE